MWNVFRDGEVNTTPGGSSPAGRAATARGREAVIPEDPRRHDPVPSDRRPPAWRALTLLAVAAINLAGCGTGPSPAGTAGEIVPPSVQLGIDVLERSGFAAVHGKRIGLLTHPAGVNSRGESTVDVLRRAPHTRLLKLFAPEHGLYGTEKASVQIADAIDARTGLPVYSLYGSNRKPTAAQLRNLDALVIDLQDIGVRSYTFNVVMRYAMDACFQHGVEVIVLDRPNPLGGQKVDGPVLDRHLFSGVGAYPIPYIHGLTIGELAWLAARTRGVLDVPEAVRARGRLTVVPMQGWRRSMRWPETGLRFVPTSQYIRDFDAVVGYAMVGLGSEYSGFTHGIGTPQPFRLLSFRGQDVGQVEDDLVALRLPGLAFRRLTVNNVRGTPVTGVKVEVVDWEEWNPTELSFHMMRLACGYRPPNPYAKISPAQVRGFNIHVGSAAWWNALRRQGARVDVETWVHAWQHRARKFQQWSRIFWLYN